MNHQINAVLAICDGHQAELDRIHQAEISYQERYDACCAMYQAKLIDAALKGERIPGTYSEYTFDPAGIIADEMDDEDHRELILACLQYKAGRMSAERAMEILCDRVDSALLMAGKGQADFEVGS